MKSTTLQTTPPLDRRQFLAAAAGFGLAQAASIWGQTSRAPHPNIVAILADDQGWGDLSIHGNKNLSTPNIDSLARDGALFDRFYVCAVCAPTRAEFLTGRYHPRGGVRGVTSGSERLNLDETTIAQTFKSAGYATGIFGKCHSGSQYPYHPTARGFDEFYGFTSGHWGQYFDTEMDRNGELVRGKGYISDDLTNHAIDFIKQNASRPFFCYLPFNTPHAPMQVPDQYWEKFAHLDPKMLAKNPKLEEIPMTRAALAMCENIDWNVGRVLAKIEELKLTNGTIVLYFSDNGPNSWRWNGGMKGRKGSVDEGGLRAPFLIRWPGHIKPGLRVAQIAGAIDLLPTLTQLAGVPVISKKPLDGRSLKPLLEGSAAAWPDRMIFSLQAKRTSVRTQQYRLDNEGLLFDMIADPEQDRDISAEKPDITAKLKSAMSAWRAEMLPLVGTDDRPFPVGNAKYTFLPARDGVAAGKIERSARPPNSSYFTNWKSKEDSISWDAEVTSPGKFEAIVYYTCRARDVGSTIELSFLGARVSRKITVVNDPPEVGAAFDRVPRGESYVKDFKPLSMGVIELKKGRGPMVLRATEIAGDQVAEMRRIVMKKM